MPGLRAGMAAQAGAGTLARMKACARKAKPALAKHGPGRAVCIAGTPGASELLMGAEVAPLPHGQIAQGDPADADALEAHDLEAHQLAHPADLPLLALG